MDLNLLMFQNLPAEDLEAILIDLPYNDMMRVCSTSIELNQWCQNDLFWKRKLFYKLDLQTIHLDHPSYRRLYKFLEENSSGKKYRISGIHNTKVIKMRTPRGTRYMLQGVDNHGRKVSRIISSDQAKKMIPKTFRDTYEELVEKVTSFEKYYDALLDEKVGRKSQSKFHLNRILKNELLLNYFLMVPGLKKKLAHAVDMGVSENILYEPEYYNLPQYPLIVELFRESNPDILKNIILTATGRRRYLPYEVNEGRFMDALRKHNLM